MLATFNANTESIDAFFDLRTAISTSPTNRIKSLDSPLVLLDRPLKIPSVWISGVVGSQTRRRAALAHDRFGHVRERL